MQLLDDLISTGGGPVIPKSAITVVDYAAARGVSRQAVEKAIRKFGIPLLGESPKLVDRDVADRMWPSVHVPAAPESDDDDDLPATEPGIAASRARREAALADMAEFKRDQEAGLLIRVDHVRKVWREVLRPLRDRLLLLPDRLAPNVAAMLDEREVREYLDAELRAVLVQVADDPPVVSDA